MLLTVTGTTSDHTHDHNDSLVLDVSPIRDEGQNRVQDALCASFDCEYNLRSDVFSVNGVSSKEAKDGIREEVCGSQCSVSFA